MPLTVQGVTAQIIGCIECYQNPAFPQEVNDCQVALNRLIRAFGEANKKPVYISNEISTYKGKIVKEHVVPVKVMMNFLLKQNIQLRNQNSFDLVKYYLDKHVVIARITSEEDGRLRCSRLHKSMLENWDEVDIWARYKAVNIDVKIF